MATNSETELSSSPATVEFLEDFVRIARIGDIAARESHSGTRRIDPAELLVIDPDLTAYLGNVVLFWEDEKADVTVDTPGVPAELPDDGSWIEEGIELKLKKYGGAEAVKDLTLVIGVEALIDGQQVASFTAAHPPESLPFAEIWINSMEGPTCLKHGHG